MVFPKIHTALKKFCLLFRAGFTVSSENKYKLYKDTTDWGKFNPKGNVMFEKYKLWGNVNYNGVKKRQFHFGSL